MVTVPIPSSALPNPQEARAHAMEKAELVNLAGAALAPVMKRAADLAAENDALRAQGAALARENAALRAKVAELEKAAPRPRQSKKEGK
jgi:cell division protein FtsB